MDIRYRPAQPADRPALVRLLQQAALLTDDLPDDLTGFWVAIADTDLVGAAGTEPFGGVGLLRSVAVRPDYQQQHIARQLLDRLLIQAQAAGLTDLYLLTISANGYFERFGFVVVPRQTVPDSIRQTRQFGSLCPDSAVLMHKSL